MKLNTNEIFIYKNICEMYLYDHKQNYKMSTFFNIQFLNKVKQHRWHSYKCKNTYYVQTRFNHNNKKFIKLHQLILPTKEPYIIDHKDHDGLNNRKDNLRRVTIRQNNENNKRNTSGFPGVCWDKNRKKWLSRIVVDKKEIYLGRFDNILNANNARQNFKKKNKIS